MCIERATQSVVGVCKHIGSSCELHTLPTQGPWAESNVSTVCIERATQSVVGVCKHIGSSCGDTHIAYTGTMG